MNSFKRFKEDKLPDIDCFFKVVKLVQKNILELAMFGKFLILNI